MQTEDTYLSLQNMNSQDHQLKTIDLNTNVRINRSEIYHENKMYQHIYFKLLMARYCF